MSSSFELHHNIKVATALNHTAISTNTATNGVVIDTAGFEKLELLFHTGTLTDGNYAIKLQHGDVADGSDMADVSAEEVLGGQSKSFAPADDNEVKRLGYIGKKRYVRGVVTSTSITTGGTVGAVSVLGMPHHAPVEED